MRENYRYMALRTLLRASAPVTFLQIYQEWGLKHHHESKGLYAALEQLVTEGTVKQDDGDGGSVFSLARPLTPTDYNAALCVTT